MKREKFYKLRRIVYLIGVSFYDPKTANTMHRVFTTVKNLFHKVFLGENRNYKINPLQPDVPIWAHWKSILCENMFILVAITRGNKQTSVLLVFLGTSFYFFVPLRTSVLLKYRSLLVPPWAITNLIS